MKHLWTVLFAIVAVSCASGRAKPPAHEPVVAPATASPTAPPRSGVWRLDKKDPGAAVSEPVRPIVCCVDPATPTKWVPWIKRGIEDWQPAFEEAGFTRAIVAREAPSPQEDPSRQEQR